MTANDPWQPQPRVEVGFSDAPDTRVVPARQPGDLLTGTRVVPLEGQPPRFGVLGRTSAAPTLGQLGTLADIALAQGVRDGAGHSASVRTLSMRLELVDPPAPREDLRARGVFLGDDPRGSVVRAVLVGHDGRRVAEALGRFMAVDGQGYSLDSEPETEAWSEVEPVEDWAGDFGLQGPDDDGRASLLPDPSTANNAPMMHGGVQQRLHELLGERALDAAASGLSAAAIETTYHRPVTVDGRTPLDARAEVIRRGRRVSVVRTSILDRASGKLLSQAQLTFIAAS